MAAEQAAKRARTAKATAAAPPRSELLRKPSGPAAPGAPELPTKIPEAASQEPTVQPKDPAASVAPRSPAASGAHAPAQEPATTSKTPESALAVGADAVSDAKSSACEVTSLWSMTRLLEMDSMQSQTDFIRTWSQNVKTRVDDALLKYLKLHQDSVPMDLPADVTAIPPLAISDAAAGASLSAFREVMHYDNLLSSFTRTGQYEAAGTLWMLDPRGGSVSDESVTIAQIEAARGQWSEDAFAQSSTNPDMRRFSFDVPLPARVDKAQMALRQGASGVAMSTPLPMIAGKAHVLAWYSAVSDALQDPKSNHKRIMRLFEAALSVPIRLRVCPDIDACAMAAIQYAEAAGMHAAAAGADSFWIFAERVGRLQEVQVAIRGNITGPKFCTKLKSLGITFKGKPMSEGHAKALKLVLPFVSDIGCKQSYLVTEVACPEVKEMTLLMRMAILCNKRGNVGASPASGGPSAAQCMTFLFDSFRAARLTGEFQKGEGMTVANIIGQEKKAAAWAHVMFKKQDLVAFLLHEAELLDETLVGAVQKLATPATILKYFSATGEDGLVDRFLKGASDATSGSLNECLAVKVSEFRDAHPGGAKVQLLIDLVWGTWAGTYEEELAQLATQELVGGSPSFLWHRHLSDSSAELGLKYRAFLAACAVGPVVPTAKGAASSLAVAGVGASELAESDQQEFKKAQELLISLRRQSVSFTTLDAGGASGAEFTQAQLSKTWEKMRLGHRFSKKKGDRRALVFSADMFPPNLTKHGRCGGLADQITADSERMKRTIAFILQKRGKDDVVMLFDGRSRPCRKVMEMFEEELAASGTYGVTEVWFVYVQPPKNKDPRVPGRSVTFASNNKEAALFSWPIGKTKEKVIHRAEFNSCGETSTTSTTYTGINMRRFGELPRMDYDTKSRILGSSTAAGVAAGKKMQADIDEKGHPFSWAEAKPIALWSRMCEHHNLTHLVDFTPGSAALAVAVAGAMQYEGIAADEEHHQWMDSILDRCIMYMVGRDKKLCTSLGGDAEFAEKVSKFFANTMQEARRYLEPLDEAQACSDASSDDDA